MSEAGAIPFAPGDVVWAHLDKRRHAIVIWSHAQAALIIYGTSKEKSYQPMVRVSHQSPDGQALGLTKPTFFYGWNLKVVALDLLESRSLPCPDELFVKILMVHKEEFLKRKR